MNRPEHVPGRSRGLDLLARTNRRLETLLAYLAGLCLAGFTVAVLVDVIYRQVLSTPLMWPSEWSIMAFIWSVMLGASVAARRRAHFVVEVLPTLPHRVEFTVQLVVVALSLVFAVVLLVYGFQMTVTGVRRFTPMVGYPLVYVFAAFPFAGAAIGLFSLEHLMELLAGKHDRRLETQAR
jgi:TRAP-type C4-dicarboxylate transport system permease small subunit